jgi:hypothetical protein
MFGITTVKLNVVAGDFSAGDWTCVVHQREGTIQMRRYFEQGETLKPSTVELVTEENKGKFLRSTGWGLVGFGLLGPLGAIAGILGTRSKKQVCFALTAQDGRRFLGSTDSVSYQHLLGTTFTR